MSFKLIVITPPTNVKKEIDIICSLFNTGLEILHVRKPGHSKKELRDYLQQFPAKFLKRVVIHSNYSLVKEFSLKGIHLTEKARKKKLSSSFHPKKHSLSASFHSVNAIQRSQRKYDYIFLSPIFESISKKGYRSNFTIDELKDLCATHKNIVALGGIEPTTLKKVKLMGFAGAATLGYIWKSKGPVKAYRKLKIK